MNSIYFETYGCTTNRADTDVMKGIVRDSNYEVVESPDKADIIVLNTCTVIDKTEKRMLRRIENFENKRLVVAGCLSSAQPETVQKIDNDAILLPPDKVGELMSYIDGDRCFEKWDAPIDFDGVIGRVQICDGCIGSCSYCITKEARGQLESSSIQNIVDRVSYLVEKGVKEIQLTAQDTAAYGKDIGTDLPTLIDRIMEIEGDFMVRVGMMNPFSVNGIENEIMEMYEYERIYNFLHLPLQSGSNEILKKMNRPYKVEFYLDLVNRYRKLVDGVLSTDVIAGFPGETDSDFQSTVEVIHQIEPDIINITRYSPRPGTKASFNQEIESSRKKDRSKRLTELRKKYGKLNKERMIGIERDVLVTKPGKEDTYIGRDPNYNTVVVKDEVDIGEWVEVELDDFTYTYLTGVPTN